MTLTKCKRTHLDFQRLLTRLSKRTYNRHRICSHNLPWVRPKNRNSLQIRKHSSILSSRLLSLVSMSNSSKESLKTQTTWPLAILRKQQPTKMPTTSMKPLLNRMISSSSTTISRLTKRISTSNKMTSTNIKTNRSTTMSKEMLITPMLSKTMAKSKINSTIRAT